ACPLLLTRTDGTRWEVMLPPGYFIFAEEDVLVLSGADGPIARTGDEFGFHVSSEVPAKPSCQWETPVTATQMLFARPIGVPAPSAMSGELACPVASYPKTTYPG
ncbi:MAG: hypothetical protein M3153_06455, partial [Chloroflexota bacterium]|nr:hypothetical protein [Chloroflexota bacterium]